MVKQPGRINVIIRLSALGDLILTTGFLQKLQHNRPNEEFVFVTSAKFRDLLREYFPIKLHFLSLAHYPFGILGYFFRGMASFRQVAALKASAIEIFDLHNVPKSRLWSLGFRFGARIHAIPVVESKVEKHRWDRWKLVQFKRRRNQKYFVYQEAQKLLAGPEIFQPRLKAERNRVNAKFNILLAMDAQHWKKIWPREKWLQLLQLLHDSNLHDLQITLVGSHSEFLQHIPPGWLKSKRWTIVNLVGKTEISELPRIAAQQDLCVCGNSAWQHICESVGTPVLSLLGPLDPEFGFSPFLPLSHEFSVDLPCRPCTLHGGGTCRMPPADYHGCMNGIHAADVFQAIAIRGAKQS